MFDEDEVTDVVIINQPFENEEPTRPIPILSMQETIAVGRATTEPVAIGRVRTKRLGSRAGRVEIAVRP